jgi:hypothetical protein
MNFAPHIQIVLDENFVIKVERIALSDIVPTWKYGASLKVQCQIFGNLG